LVSTKIAFITGGSGFVGSALSRSLIEQGWIVRKDPLRLLAEPHKWREAMNAAQCVVHLAAHVHQMDRASSNSDKYQEINVEGSRFVAQQAALAGVPRLVFLSSVKVHGEGGESAYLSTDQPHPCDPYGVSKLQAEIAVREVCDHANLEYVMIRPPLIYGPGVKANFNRLIRLVDYGVPLPLLSVENRRSLVGLSNLVSFIELCMTHPRACNKVWLLADDEPMSTPNLLRRIANHMGRKTRLFAFPPRMLRLVAGLLGRQAEISRLCDSLTIDSSPARIELGWHPVSSSDDELARTIAAYQAGKML